MLLSIGATIKAVYNDYHHFLDDRYLSAPNLLIAVGAIILLVSFLGCCGAVKENHCMIVSVSHVNPRVGYFQRLPERGPGRLSHSYTREGWNGWVF